MARKRREVDQFSLSFLDCICCGFGAIVLLLVLSKIYEPAVLEKTEEDLRQLIAKLQEELFEIRGESTIVVRSAGHVYFLRPDEILWVEAAGDYVAIHTDKKEHILRETMTRMEKRLLPYGFQRIHRSTIVSLDAIAELVSNDSGDYEVVLRSGQRLKLSRSYRDELYLSLNA